MAKVLVVLALQSMVVTTLYTTMFVLQLGIVMVSRDVRAFLSFHPFTIKVVTNDLLNWKCDKF